MWFFLTERHLFRPPTPRHKMGIYPCRESGDLVEAGDTLAPFQRDFMSIKSWCPFLYQENGRCANAPAGEYTVEEEIALIEDESGKTIASLCKLGRLKFQLAAIPNVYVQLNPCCKIMDNRYLFPRRKRGEPTAFRTVRCRKTVLQQITSRNAEVDIVIVAACVSAQARL